MFDAHSFYLFLGTAVVLVLSPGPDTMLVLSRTLVSGTLAGLMTLLGTQVGNVIHAILAGVGVSTLVLLFPPAFIALKAIGVGYLLYLAIQSWRASSSLLLDSGLSIGGSARRHFAQGLISNLANPKMIAFFIALFPQFVHPESGSLALQSFVLGGTLAVMAFLWIGSMVTILGRFRSSVATTETFQRVAQKLAALTFVGLALRLAVQRND